MSAPLELSSVEYRWVLVDPAVLADDLVAPTSAALPSLFEPDPQPLVLDPSPEPLVRLEHRRVRDLAVYFHTGWPAAPPRTWLRESVADLLVHAVDALPDPFGFALLDGWRPLATQQAIFDAAYADPSLPPGFVSVPSADPLTPPPHLTGGTVDVSLTWRNVPLALGTPFDCFSDAARTSSFEDAVTPADLLVRDLRRLLFWSLSSVGFTVIDCEWWHFEFGTRRWAALRATDPLFGPAELPAVGCRSQAPPPGAS